MKITHGVKWNLKTTFCITTDIAQDNSFKGIGNWSEGPQSVVQDQKSDNLQYDKMGQ